MAKWVFERIWLVLWVSFALLACSDGTRSRSEQVTATERAALTVIAQHDWEDGTLESWIPRGGGVVLANSTEAAADGTLGSHRRRAPTHRSPSIRR